MGLFGDKRPAGSRRFQMREDLLSIGDDFWIEDEEGAKVFRVDGKALRVRDTFILEDAHGKEVAQIRERKLAIRDSMKIEVGEKSATVKKRLVGIRDHYKIDLDDGPDYSAHGNIVDHEYEIERDGDTVAHVSKKWFRLRDTYGVDVIPKQDVVLILAITVCVDAMARAHDLD